MCWVALRRAALFLSLGLLALWALRSAGGGAHIPVGTRIADVRAELDDGRVYKLGERPGEVLVLNFWASWCAPCRREIPILSGLRGRGVEVVGVAIEKLPLAILSAKARGMGAGYPVAADRTGLVQRFGVGVVPTTYVIAADGVVVFGRSGLVGRGELQNAIARAKAR
jgi:thiol-disulfide isomerase/thioredoxin